MRTFIQKKVMTYNEAWVKRRPSGNLESQSGLIQRTPSSHRSALPKITSRWCARQMKGFHLQAYQLKASNSLALLQIMTNHLSQLSIYPTARQETEIENNGMEFGENLKNKFSDERRWNEIVSGKPEIISGEAHVDDLASLQFEFQSGKWCQLPDFCWGRIWTSRSLTQPTWQQNLSVKSTFRAWSELLIR